jgi:hypothetical protein
MTSSIARADCSAPCSSSTLRLVGQPGRQHRQEHPAEGETEQRAAVMTGSVAPPTTTRVRTAAVATPVTSDPAMIRRIRPVRARLVDTAPAAAAVERCSS